jgi:hypothetical protein
VTGERLNHYDTLGVAHAATTTQIRDAYRRAARDAHPDRHGSQSADRMAAVNEAWRILGDPVRRRAYDDSIGEVRPSAGASSTGSAAGSGHRDLSYLTSVVHPPARVPWKFLASMGVAAIVLLLVGRLFVSEAPPTGPDNILQAGDCVTLSTTLEATEVLCSDAYDAIVRALVPFDQQCPNGTEVYRDRQGMGNACVERTAQ